MTAFALLVPLAVTSLHFCVLHALCSTVQAMAPPVEPPSHVRCPVTKVILPHHGTLLFTFYL